MCQWIEKAWMELKADYIAESFKYCGITTSVIAEYQSNLIKLLTDAELPLNSSVEARNEEDEHTDIFLNHDADEGPASETNSSTDGSTESVSASEQSTSDTSTSESSPASPTTTTTTASTYITESTKTPSTTAPPTATQSTPVLKAISNITITRINKPKALSTSTPRVKSTSLSELDQSQRASNIENLLLPPKPVVPRPATPPKEKQPKKAQKPPAAAKNIATSKTQKSPAATKNVASSTITAVVISPAGVCAKCGDKTNYRVCNAKDCSKKTCLNCFGTKVTPSDVHFCSRSCQRK